MALKKTNTKKNAPMPKKNGLMKVSPGKAARVKKSKFEGAKSIQLTKKNIVVTRVVSKNEPGAYVKVESRRYYPQTPENMQELARAVSGREVKKAGFELK